jgi:DNA-binding XRE family transcriptional regulator
MPRVFLFAQPVLGRVHSAIHSQIEVATHGSVDRELASRQRAGCVEGDLQQMVGQNLRLLRTARGLSQEDFADLLGVHRTYLGGIERGERNLTLKSLERIAERIKVDPIALLTEG